LRAKVAVIRAAIGPWLSAVENILAAEDRITADIPLARQRLTGDLSIFAAAPEIDIANVPRADIMVIAEVGQAGVANRAKPDTMAQPVTVVRRAYVGVRHTRRAERRVE
jgi:hypothetical protein